jgi:hypothetical protein
MVSNFDQHPSRTKTHPWLVAGLFILGHEYIGDDEIIG